jgi:hypothetical protein
VIPGLTGRLLQQSETAQSVRSGSGALASIMEGR